MNTIHFCQSIALVLDEGSCDAQRVLRDLLDLLVQANLHEALDVEDDAIYASIAEAQGLLFRVATAHAARV